MNLKTYIEKNGLKQSDYKKALGIHPSTVWRIINDKFTPRPETAKLIEEKTNGAVTRMELLYP